MCTFLIVYIALKLKLSQKIYFTCLRRFVTPTDAGGAIMSIYCQTSGMFIQELVMLFLCDSEVYEARTFYNKARIIP